MITTTIRTLLRRSPRTVDIPPLKSRRWRTVDRNGVVETWAGRTPPEPHDGFWWPSGWCYELECFAPDHPIVNENWRESITELLDEVVS